VIVAVDHTKVKYGLIRRHARLIYDIKNVYQNMTDKAIVRF
jgi:UDP-N-acetyl-D-mannosaminuronate dehydrogenase